mgnify:CR=1 FL=1
MANNSQNLIPLNKRSKELQREIQEMGREANKKKWAEKMDFKKKCQLWMETEVAKDKNGNPMTGADLMIAVAGKGIKDGNTKFWELMRDTAGFKPVDKVMVADVDQDVVNEVERAVLGNDEKASD